VDDLETGVDAVRYLSEGKRGRATLIPNVPSGERAAFSEPPTAQGVVGRLPIRFLTDFSKSLRLLEYKQFTFESIMN
jgi:hypothetical protein